MSADPLTAVPADGERLAEALTLADAAARSLLELRSDSPQGNLYLALFAAEAPADEPQPDPTDTDAVVAYMDRRLIAQHGLDDPDAVVPGLGLSRRQITRLKAFECVHLGADAYDAIVTRRKFDGATRSFGSHLFSQITAEGTALPLIAAASGWRGDQDYVAAMMVPAALLHIRLGSAGLPRGTMVTDGFVLSGGAWEYPLA